jgi:hypothetical protein
LFGDGDLRNSTSQPLAYKQSLVLTPGRNNGWNIAVFGLSSILLPDTLERLNFMNWSGLQKRAVREVLATLYPKETQVRTLLSDAGVPTGKIDLSGGAETMWFNTIEELVKRGEIDKVLAIARQDNPNAPAWLTLQVPASPTAAVATTPATTAPSPPVTVSTTPTTKVQTSPPVVDTTWRITDASAIDFRKLEGQQWRALQAALVDAFPSIDELRTLAKFRLNENLNTIVSSQNINTATFDLIQWTQSRGWTERLYQAARAERPDHAGLAEFGFGVKSPKPGAVAKPAVDTSLERLIRAGTTPVKLVDLMKHLGEAQARVCQIRIHGKAFGTGFLIGPSAVMTNHHVVEDVLSGKVEPEKVALHFDVHGNSDGSVFRLADDWMIDASPPADFERYTDTGPAPDEDHLDYAILRVEGSPGKKPIGDAPTQTAPPRGCFLLPGGDVGLTASDALYIVQHPQGRSMEIALEMDGGATFNKERTRMAHRVNTEGGSSGSPVFTLDGKLVALHHSGASSVIKAVNGAIPIDTIRASLERRGKLAELSS